MRMSRTHKITVTAVMTTIAAATVLTFTRPDLMPADRIASMPQSSDDSPGVERRDPAATETTPTPRATTPSPKPKTPDASGPKSETTRTGPAGPTEPAAPTAPTEQPAKPADPTPAPTPSPTPSKNLLETLLGQ